MAWPSVPERLWRASFMTRGAEPPDDLLALEELALSVSLFALEDPATADPVGWQIELFFAAEPEREALLAALAAILGRRPELAIEAVPPQDWVAASAMQQEPVRVGRFFVHAAKDRDRVPAAAVPIEVEAGLAFGSGEHATTQACLAAIDALARRRRVRRVLDLGCGSGILAMAAARCWPARVLASDSDPIAVRVAQENLQLNRLGARVTVVQADGFAHPLIRRRGPFDLILANILADPLIEMAPALARHTARRGMAVLSGLLDRQGAAVERACALAGLRLVTRIAHGPWRGLVFRRSRSRAA